MKGLDLRKFKKVSTNGGSATFKHSDGHEIKIAVSKLSKSMQKDLEKIPHYDDGGMVEDADRNPASISPEDQAASAQRLNMSPREMAEIAATQPAPAAQQLPPEQGLEAGAAAPQYSGPAMTKAPEQPGMLDAYGKAFMGGVGEQKQGIQGTAQVQEQGQADVAHQLNNLAEFEHDQPGGWGDIVQRTQNEAFDRRNAFLQDINNKHIDPNRIFHNMDTGQKVATGIGLLLGGMGAGLTGQPNLAYDFLMKQRNADIAAQVKDVDKGLSLYHDNLRDFGDHMDALNMTKINMNDAISHRLQAVAATTNSQNAKNVALQAVGQLDKDSAMLQGLIGMGNKGGNNIDNTIQAMEVLNPALAKTLKEKYVPGVGVASIAVPEADRKQITARQDLDNKLVQLRQFANEHAGSLNPAIINQGSAMSKLAQDAYRQANSQGVFREAEKDFVNGVISDNPTAFFNKFRTDPGYKAAEEGNRQSLGTLYKNYGLKQPGGISGGSGQIKSFRPKK